MRIETTLEDGRCVEYFESFWTGRRTLAINGKEVTKTGRKTFSDNQDGTTVEYTAQGSFLTGVTLVSNNGESYVLAKNKWYDWIMIFLPLVGMVVGVFMGGAIGGFLSALLCLGAAAINATISRTKLHVAAKIPIQIAVALVANAILLVIYFLVVDAILAVV